MRRTDATKLVAGTILLVATGGNAFGEDKSQYSLLNPTPDRLLRDFTPDRPDSTEGPFTIDAGRIQVETTLFGYARSRRDQDGAVTDTYELGTTNVRIGLTHNTEFNVIWQPYGVVRTRHTNPPDTARESGIGGLALRAKVNLWGNDSFEKAGSTALALLPFVTLPTDRHNGISPEFVEGGVIVPYAIKLSDKVDLGLNAGVSWIKSDAASGYHPEYLTSASLSYEWSKDFSTYYEVLARFHTEDPRGDVVILATGFTYKIANNVQFDGGVNVGVTSASDVINPFVGISTRF